MSLLEKLRGDLSEAIREGHQMRIGTLRMLFAAIKNKEIEERKKDIGLSDEEVIGVLQKETKKRKDAIKEFSNVGRHDLAEKEQKELEVLEAYLPEELSDEEIVRIIKDGIREIGGPDPKQFGALMKVIMPTLKGRASGDRITKLAQEALAS